MLFGVLAGACLAGSSSAAPTSRSYIQKGLAACYDGVENAGAGVHDPHAATWVDLTGHGNDGTVGSGITWAANGWVCTGGADLAAKVRFTCGPQGVGTVTTAGALTIGPGATLEVDSTALEARGLFPLISFDSCEGDFASITVTGRGSVRKTSSGYVLDRSSSTTVIVR